MKKFGTYGSYVNSENEATTFFKFFFFFKGKNYCESIATDHKLLNIETKTSTFGHKNRQ